jgi:cyclase
MFRARVIPMLLFGGEGLVKTVNFKNPTYIGDPINAVKIFNDLESDELIFVDIKATKEDRITPLNVIKNIGDEAFMPFAVGGGIKTLKNAKAIIEAGAEKVVINSAAVTRPKIISEIVEVYGSQSVIVSIDTKKNLFGNYNVYINGGKQKTDLNPCEHAKNMERLGAGEILITSISHEGRMKGLDIEIIKKVCNSVKVPVIAHGGAWTRKHLKSSISDGGAHAVAAGSMFVYFGERKGILINYPEKKILNDLLINE